MRVFKQCIQNCEMFKKGKDMELREFVERISQGNHFRINLANNECKLNGKIVILTSTIADSLVNDLNCIYREYKESYPSERSKRGKSYFKALEFEEMTDDMLVLGGDRLVQQALLEGFILSQRDSIREQLFSNTNNWYWQSNEDEDFIILKEWCL